MSLLATTCSLKLVMLQLHAYTCVIKGDLIGSAKQDMLVLSGSFWIETGLLASTNTSIVLTLYMLQV